MSHFTFVVFTLLFSDVVPHSLVVSYQHFWTTLKMGLIGCPTTLMNNYQSMLCHIPDKQISLLHCSWSVKLCIAFTCCLIWGQVIGQYYFLIYILRNHCRLLYWLGSRLNCQRSGFDYSQEQVIFLFVTTSIATLVLICPIQCIPDAVFLMG